MEPVTTVVFCTYCGQSFTRHEHLERHILTHTNIKPFKCSMCHISFTRRDLLQRHFSVHGRDKDFKEDLALSDGTNIKFADRTPIACRNCARSKTKCDKKFPCSRCTSRNLTCTLRPTRRIPKQKNSEQGSAKPKKDGSVSLGSASTESNTNNALSCSPGHDSSPAQLLQDRQQLYPQQLLPQQQQCLSQQKQTAESTYGLHHSSFWVSPQAIASIGSSNTHHASSENENSVPHSPPMPHSPPTFLEHNSSISDAPTVLFNGNNIPSILTPLNGFAQHSPDSSYEQFASTTTGSREQATGPLFAMDWQKMSTGTTPFDTSTMTPGMGMDLTAMHTTPPGNSIFSLLSDFTQTLPPTQVPTTTPYIHHDLSDLELDSFASLLYPLAADHVSGRAVRPLWWAGAIYRVTLVMWTNALVDEDMSPPNGTFPVTVTGPSFPIDNLPVEHPSISRYLTKREGVPTLTKRDGSFMGIQNALAVLSHCIDIVDKGYATTFCDGIRRQLKRLARG